MQIFDGKEYSDTEMLPDLGSIVCVAVTGGGKREYRGLSSDFGKLREYAKKANLLTGCLVRFEDTNKTYEYFAIDQQWHEYASDISSGGSGSSGTGTGPSYDFNVVGEHLYINQL